MSNRTVWWIDGWMDGSLDGIGMAWKRIYANVHDHWLTFWKITLKTHSVCHKSHPDTLQMPANLYIEKGYLKYMAWYCDGGADGGGENNYNTY